MGSSHVQVYSAEQETAAFFARATSTRPACDAYALQQVGGGDVIPVAIQGECSYTVYAGANAAFVVQFRPRSLRLDMGTMERVSTVYGEMAPRVEFRGEIGDDGEGADGKEPLCVYVMNRIRGISYLDFILAHNGDVAEDSPEYSAWRQTFIADAAKFFASSWKAPQATSEAHRASLFSQYEKELNLLHATLPARFHPFIQDSLASLSAIFDRLPMVLLHRDYGLGDVMVTETSCNLVGAVDWAEAGIAPFGLNLHAHQRFISKIDPWHGWARFADYALLEELFWRTFREEIGEGDEIIGIINKARIVGLLLSSGFTCRIPLAGMPPPEPIRAEDDKGAYKMRDLDGLLLDPATRFTELT